MGSIFDLTDTHPTDNREAVRAFGLETLDEVIRRKSADAPLSEEGQQLFTLLKRRELVTIQHESVEYEDGPSRFFHIVMSPELEKIRSEMAAA